jgi:hypothetical protein
MCIVSFKCFFVKKKRTINENKLFVDVYPQRKIKLSEGYIMRLTSPWQKIPIYVLITITPYLRTGKTGSKLDYLEPISIRPCDQRLKSSSHVTVRSKQSQNCRSESVIIVKRVGRRLEQKILIYEETMRFQDMSSMRRVGADA